MIQSRMENEQSHVITVTGKIIKILQLKPETQCNTSTMFLGYFFFFCNFFFFSIHKTDRVHQQSEYSQSSKRESISSQLGRSCGSAQQSANRNKNTNL